MNRLTITCLVWLSLIGGSLTQHTAAQTSPLPRPGEPAPAEKTIEKATDTISEKPSESTPPALATEQKSVSERFGRLENLLLRSADLEAGENPARAALLQQAVQLSKQTELRELLADAASRLERGQYSEAIEKQKASRENLKRLLELLQSENRAERIREERDEVRRWIEETDRLLRLQSSLRGRTEGGQETEQSAKDQKKLTDKAEEIASELKGEQSPTSKDSETKNSELNSEQSSKTSDTKPSESNDKPKSAAQPSDASEKSPPDGEETKEQKSDGEKSGDQPASDKDGQSRPKQDSPQSESNGGKDEQQLKPNSSEPSTEKPSDTDSSPDSQQPKSSEQSDEQSSDKQQGQPQSQQPSDSGQGKSGESPPDQQPQPPQSPTQRAKQKIEQAQKNMQQAQKQLEQAEREGAVEQQREAEERLREAIEELEEILRQLREEEVERSLASLETRLRRMLEMQNKVLEETTRLQEITGEGANRQVQISAGKLSLDERKILAEGERAFLLLREEGSSAAFPEAIEQLNTDIDAVAERLNAGDVGKLTVNIEQEIVKSLEEMAEALAQVQKDNRKKQQQQQQGQAPPPGDPGDQPLVDKLAELRLIRTLQLRINNRTDTLSKLLADPADAIGQAAEQDIQEQLQGLAQRQSSIQHVTRDIVVGKGE